MSSVAPNIMDPSLPALTTQGTATPTPATTQDNTPNKKCAGNWCGRTVREIRDFFVELGNGLEQGAIKIIRVVGKLSMDSTSLARLCRLGITAFAVIEMGIGKPGIFSAASTQMATAEEFIYTVSMGDQIKYFGTGEQKKEPVVCSLGQGALLLAGIGGVFVLLGKATLINFAKIGQAIGSVPVLGAVTQLGISFSQCVSGVASVGFGLLAIDAALKLSKAKTKEEKVQHTIDLAWMISELALAAFLTSGVKNIWGFAALATVSAGLGIASFVYKMHVEDQQEKAKEQLKLS